MKNFNLLLATTAILSTGLVMSVNATDPTVKMNIGVNVHRASTFQKFQDINFGSVIIPDNATELHLTMDRDGTIQGDSDGESLHVLGDSYYGITSGAPCALLQYPNTIELTMSSGEGSQNIITAQATNIICYDNNYDPSLYNNVYDGISSNLAKFYAENLDITSTGRLPTGIYTGTFTITAVYPE